MMADQAHPVSPDTTAAAGGASTPTERYLKQFLDVWSRWGTKYRKRAIVLLAINVLLFMGVCCFAFWLRSGESFAPFMDSYWGELADTFKFRGERNITLQTLLLDPISVQDVPMQILILGLLLAALISIPITVSILYRFWSAVPFILAVGFVAMMPWLAITLIACCVIASVRPFRTSIRFMSALLALVPAAIYLFMASSGSEVIEGSLDPIERIKFIAPWALAIVASAVVFAIVLTLAKLVNFRPGAIAPLLAMMFGLPVALFELHVGRDELHYRLISALDRYTFEDIDASLQLEELVERRWLRHPRPKPSRASVREMVELNWQFYGFGDFQEARNAFDNQRALVIGKWNWFLDHFPHSRYALNALYFKARALDMRIDRKEFRRSKWIRFYDDFPREDSKPIWEMILQHQPPPELAGAANLRLAQINARDDGHIGKAIEQLEHAVVSLALDDSAPLLGLARPSSRRGVFDRQNPVADLELPVERLKLEASRLLGLVIKNDDPLWGHEPICGSPFEPKKAIGGLMDMDPRSENYGERLAALNKAFERCQLEDNIDLEIAKATDENDVVKFKATSVLALKIQRLEELVERLTRSPIPNAAAGRAEMPESMRDALPEALFHLGAAYRQNNQPVLSQQRFEELTRHFPQSTWATQAQAYAGLPVITTTAKARG
jgi:hypothetical protein